MENIKAIPESEWEDCPNCDNIGWNVSMDGQGFPIQEQCEFCYVNEKSVFNQKELQKKAV